MKVSRGIRAQACSTLALVSGLALFSLALPGCASEPTLTLTSIDHRQSYRQAFTQAYAGRDANGDLDVVLVDQATEQALAGDGNAASIRQVMHIRVIWAATRDMKGIAPNAAVTWYVIRQSPPVEILQYSGIGSVTYSDDESTTTLKIKNTVLKPSESHGNLTDPVGPSRLEGSFVAKQDNQIVEKILGDLKAAVVASAPQAAPVVSTTP